MRTHTEYYVDLAKLYSDHPRQKIHTDYAIFTFNRCAEFVRSPIAKEPYSRILQGFGFWNSEEKDKRIFSMPYSFLEIMRRFLAFTAYNDCGTRADAVYGIFKAMQEAAENEIASLPEVPVEIEDQHTISGLEE